MPGCYLNPPISSALEVLPMPEALALELTQPRSRITVLEVRLPGRRRFPVR
jgi:hypothetical protein